MPNTILSRADHDRLRQRVADGRRLDKKVADAARHAVADYLQGRPASACMNDLVRIAREIRT